MTLPSWLRFIELSLIAAWLAWELYRPTGKVGGRPWLPAAAAVVSLVQFGLTAREALDPFTPPGQILPVLLASAFGVASLATAVLGAWLAAWQARSGAGGLWKVSGPLGGAVLLACGAVASIGAADASAAAQAFGEIAMSPTLSVPRAALSTPNPYAGDPASAERGRAVFQQYCVTCHGLNGDGNGPAVGGLRVRPPSFRNPGHFLTPGMDGAHFWAIQHGDGQAGGMPAWQGTLSDRDTWDALNYIKTIAAGHPAGATASSDSSRPGG